MKNIIIPWTLVLVVAILLRVFYLFATPAGQTPDEIQIIDRVWKTAQNIHPAHEALHSPQNYVNNVFYYPPLYFYLSALIILITTGFQTPPIHFETAFSTYSQTLRVISLFLTMGSLFLIWKIIERFEFNDQIKISIYIFIALIPTFANFSIYPNQNVLFFFLVTLYFYLLIVKQYKTFDFKQPSILGIVTGLSLLTKTEGVILLPLFPFSLLFSSKKQKIILPSIIFLFFAFISGGLWYFSNLLKYGWFYNQQLVGGGIDPVAPFSFSFYLPILFITTLISFFATFGIYNNIILHPAPYAIFIFFILISILGLIKGRFFTSKNSYFAKKPYLLLGGAFLINLGIYLMFNLFYEYQPQGRLLFPSLIFLGLTIIVGISSWFKNKYLYLLPIFLIGILIFSNWWSLNCIVKSFYNISIAPTVMNCSAAALIPPPIHTLK